MTQPKTRLSTTYLLDLDPQRPGETLATPRMVRRAESLARVKEAMRRFSETSKRVLGEEAQVALAAEIEAVATIKGSNAEDFPLRGEGENNALPYFQTSPVILRIDGDEAVHTQHGAKQLTHEGNFGQQIEIVTRHKTPKGRLIPPEEMAKALEIATQMIRERAATCGLADVDYRAVPYRERGDQASSCQWNIHFENAQGKNLFDNGKGYESALHLLFADEFLKFEKEGGLLLSVPTPEAFERIGRKADTEPKQHFVGIRKARGNFPTFFLRGPNRDVARAEDPRPHKHVDKGGVRLEKRSGAPGSVTAYPEVSPSLMIEAILAVATHTLERYATLSEQERQELSAEKLWAIPPQDFPNSYAELYNQFANSSYIKEHYASLRERTLGVLHPQVTPTR
jgi:hypothetical protein